MVQAEQYQVIIVGAGPVGLLHAIRLGEAGIKTLILEKHDGLLPTTRAMVYQPVVLHALKSLGILDQVKQNATINREGIFWRDINGEEMAHISLLEDEYVLLYGQKRMAELLLEILKKYPSVQVRYAHDLVGCQQDGKKVKCLVRWHGSPTGDDLLFEADWVVGTDGANSAVRRSLCITYEGYTHTEFRMIGVDVLFDFSKESYGSDINFVVDPENWAVVAYTGQNKDLKPDGEPLWRVAYGESNDFPGDHDSIWERAQARVAKYAPNHKGPFNITRAEPYQLQQRCATEAIKGRVILAGDALHNNNPIGGLGLVSGILDAYTISNALVRVVKHGEPDTLMTEAANDRRDTWLGVTSPMTVKNFERIRSLNHEAAQERDQYFERLKADPKFGRGQVLEMTGKEFGVKDNGVVVQ